MKNPLVIFITVLFVTGCGDEFPENTFSSNDCNLLETKEDVDELITECNDNRFDSVSEIEDNLIGDWALSAIIPGWIPYESTSECLILSINDNCLTLSNLDTGEQSSSAWELILYEVNGYPVYYLEPEDEDLRWSVGMQFFSKDIMYGSGLADDTDTYIYVK